MLKLNHHKDYKPDNNCNGCGSGWSALIVPDTIYGLDIKQVCCIHDDRYERGGNLDDKRLADREFLDNLLILINDYKKWYYPHWLARHRALTYYDAVVRAGHGAFNFKKDYL